MYSLRYKVTTSTCDSEGRLKLYSALQMMQDCSEMWIDSEPTARKFFNDNNMTQLLATRQVEVVRVPRFKEDLTVTTSIYEVLPMYGFRNTFIRDAKGQPCYRTWSMGAFVDLATGRLARLSDDAIASLTLEPKQEMNYRGRRIILPKQDGTVLDPVSVMRADIDYNRHMNNANYVRIAMELLPDGFEVTDMRVEYRIAAKLGGMATLLTTNKGQRLTLENSYLWRHYPSLNMQEFTGALQVGWYARHVNLHLGLCNRYHAELVLRNNGGMGTVLEPMNVMFAAEGWWYNQLAPHQWNVGLRWSNYNDFIIERVANWFFSAKAWYRLPENTAFYAEVGLHPVGSLNLTASYDGWFLHLGAIRTL
jgi:acyl-ACP thioesterase